MATWPASVSIGGNGKALSESMDSESAIRCILTLSYSSRTAASDPRNSDWLILAGRPVLRNFRLVKTLDFCLRAQLGDQIQLRFSGHDGLERVAYRIEF
jgi:hypothetical protein